ncbi:MAG: hypothetical protein JRD04_10445 [Deltaproteobacteria bacterium]|nr:hypothetical protein [Deltaproteobacteria bacterium]
MHPFEVLDGWEILDAAKKGAAVKIQMVVYEEGAIEIKTPVPGFSYINYAGTEKRYSMDNETGAPQDVQHGAHKELRQDLRHGSPA